MRKLVTRKAERIAQPVVLTTSQNVRLLRAGWKVLTVWSQYCVVVAPGDMVVSVVAVCVRCSGTVAEVHVVSEGGGGDGGGIVRMLGEGA